MIGLLVMTLRNAVFLMISSGFQVHSSTAQLLTVTATRIARIFNIALYILFLKGMDIMAFFTNLSLQEFHDNSLALFSHFSVMNSFVLFWIASLLKSVLLMLFLPRAPFLVTVFSCYTLMIFLVMLTVIMLSILMILVSNLNMIKFWTCTNRASLVLNLNLNFRTW